MNRLTRNDLDYVPEQPYFVQLGSQHIADLDAELPGYDSAMLDFGSAVGTEPDEGSAMDAALADAAFTPGDFQAQNYDPINRDWSAMSPGFEAQLAENENGLTSDPTPGGGDPNPNPGPQPPGGTAPTVPPAKACGASDFPGLQMTSMTTLNPRQLNDTPDTTVYVVSDQRSYTMKLVQGDPAVWSISFQGGPPVDGPFGRKPIVDGLLHASLKKAGHFSAAVSLQFAGESIVKIFGYCIDIA